MNTTSAGSTSLHNTYIKKVETNIKLDNISRLIKTVANMIRKN